MNLSKLQEIVKVREAWYAQSMRSQRVGHDLATEQQLTETVTQMIKEAKRPFNTNEILKGYLRRSNQSILKEINPEYSLEGPMLKLKRQYFGYLMRRADSLEKPLMLGKTDGKKRWG